MSGQRTIGVYQPRSRRRQAAEAIASFRDFLVELLAETMRRAIGLALILLAVIMLAATGNRMAQV